MHNIVDLITTIDVISNKLMYVILFWLGAITSILMVPIVQMTKFSILFGEINLSNLIPLYKFHGEWYLEIMIIMEMLWQR